MSYHVPVKTRALRSEFSYKENMTTGPDSLSLARFMSDKKAA